MIRYALGAGGGVCVAALSFGPVPLKVIAAFVLLGVAIVAAWVELGNVA